MYRERLRTYLHWLLQPPHLGDLSTFCGIWVLNGIFASLLFRFFFSRIFESTEAEILAGICSISIVAYLLSNLGFTAMHAYVISVGGMCIALVYWPTISLNFSTSSSIALTTFAIIISLPLFCRGMELSRLNQKN